MHAFDHINLCKYNALNGHRTTVKKHTRVFTVDSQGGCITLNSELKVYKAEKASVPRNVTKPEICGRQPLAVNVRPSSSCLLFANISLHKASIKFTL